MFSEVKISKPVELHDSEQPAESKPQPAALLLLAVLLAAAITALCVTTYVNVQTKHIILNRLDEHGAKDLTDTMLPKCPNVWEQYGGHCYYFTTTHLNWNQSREVCQALGGDLVVIDSEEEQTLLAYKVRKKMKFPEDKFWIGLMDSKEEGKWLWVDGKPLNQSFWLVMPDNWKGEDPDGEDCAMMGETSSVYDLKCWGDKSCKDPQKSICEKREEKGVCP